ncbi:MAG: hypothetical protein AMXMBFR33_53260 [Candidatus Xenobia bacterium]
MLKVLPILWGRFQSGRGRIASKPSGRAFTLAEVMLAVGLLALLVLTLAGLTLSAIRSNEKAARLDPATEVLESVLDESVYQVTWDSPAGTRASFWGAAGTWQGPLTRTVGGTRYEYTLYANNVPGFAAGNRLKKLDIVLWWWDSRSSGGTRQGYGKMQLEASRVVHETPPP